MGEKEHKRHQALRLMSFFVLSRFRLLCLLSIKSGPFFPRIILCIFFFAILSLIDFFFFRADALLESGALAGSLVRFEQMGQPLDLLGGSDDGRRHLRHSL